MSQKDEIKACLIASFETRLDDYMLANKFVRKRNSLLFKRRIGASVQVIDTHLSIHPKERRDAAASVYPWLEVIVPEVDEIVEQMTGGNVGLLEGITAARSRQPIEINSEKTAGALWYIFQADSVPLVVDDLKHFLASWTLPLLNAYATPEDIIAADDRRDGRLLRDRAQILRVIAAVFLHSGPRAALAMMEESFGSIGLRRRYAGVFDYLAARAVSH